MTKKSFTLKIPAPKPAKGHQPHRGGSGTHADRRTKRNRTRASVSKNEIRSFA